LIVLAASAGHGGPSFRLIPAPDPVRPDEAERPVILFVEDQPMVRYTVAEELSDAGYTVIQAETGEDALALLASGAAIDALLTDLRLPGAIDGWDVAEAARELRPTLPVVYASAYSYVTPRQVSNSIMLDKPCPPEAIVDALERLLG
jgi:CheY-like chemotaxis protein